MHKLELRLGLYFTAIAYGISFWDQPANDPDLGWHLVGGAWISAHHAVPLHDFINSFNPYWHDYHWLAQLVMYALYALGGYALLQLGLGLVMACICKLVIDVILLASPRRPSLVFVLTCFLGAVTFVAEGAAVRPQILAVAIVALALRRLIQKPRPWEIPYLFLLTVLLVNVHVYWVFIPFLWFLHRCAPRFVSARAPSAAYAWSGLGVLALSGLVSPYGLVPGGFTPPFLFMNYALIWDYLTMPPALKSAIAEFQGSLGLSGLRPWLALLYFVALARIFRWRHLVVDTGSTLGALISLLLLINSRKFLPVFGVVSLPYIARHGGAFLRLKLKSAAARWERGFSRALLPAALLGSLVLAAWHFPWVDADTSYIHTFTACRHIAGMSLSPPASRDHVRVLTDFNFAGWCRWVLYQERPDGDFRVTTDGRTQWVPVEHFQASFGIANASGDWLPTLRRWDPDVLLVQKGTPLASVLLLAPGIGKLVFEDEHFAVFLPLGREPAAASAATGSR